MLSFYFSPNKANCIQFIIVESMPFYGGYGVRETIGPLEDLIGIIEMFGPWLDILFLKRDGFVIIL